MVEKGFKPELRQDLERAINELFEAAQIPSIIKRGFLFDIQQILNKNMIKETPFEKGDKK